MVRIYEIQLFNLLKPKLGDMEAEAIVDYINLRFNDHTNELYKNFVTKEDLLKSESRLNSRISLLDTRISETKSDILRWVVGIFIVTMMAIIGLYFK